MRTGHADRRWAIGGILTAAVLLAGTWFFLISPQNSDTRRLQDQASAAQLRLPSLQRRLAELRQQNGDLAQYQGQLVRGRQALPTTSALSDFLRGLQKVGDSAGVSVSGVTVDTPIQATTPGAKVYALPISLTATGAVGKVEQFLDQLQQGQPRAVLISTANVGSADQSGSFADSVSLTLSMQVFVAPASGSGNASPTPKAS